MHKGSLGRAADTSGTSLQRSAGRLGMQGSLGYASARRSSPVTSSLNGRPPTTPKKSETSSASSSRQSERMTFSSPRFASRSSWTSTRQRGPGEGARPPSRGVLSPRDLEQTGASAAFVCTRTLGGPGSCHSPLRSCRSASHRAACGTC